jgi:hypothetical protein
MLRFLKPLSLTSHGAIVLIIGLAFLFPNLSLVLSGVETEGVVVDFKAASAGSWSSGGNQPVVKFYDPDGAPITFTSSAHVGWRFGPSRGEQVRVIYDPDDPTKAAIGSFMLLWFLPTAFLAAGLICVFLGLTRYFHRRAPAE